MLSRLVLGAGPTALTLVDAVSDDADELVVVRGDQTDRRVLADLDIDPDTVMIAADDPAANVAAAEPVASLFPDAFVLGYAGRGATDAQADQIRAVADRFVDPATAFTDHLEQTVGDSGTRVRKLQRVLRDIDGKLAIVTHDNPDPDAIGSAVALAELAQRAGCAVSVCYYGEIAHQENRAFVNLLDYDLTNLDGDPDALDGFGGFALVDHSRPGVNDQLPSDLDIDVVVDHHPPRLPVEARFVDLRSGVGATSTLLVDYFRRLDIDIPGPIATGLLFGIRVDTKDFRREVAADDFEAAAHLVPRADMNALQRIEDPSISAETLSTIGRAIANREQEGSVLLSCVGEITDRDALAQAADKLLDLDGIQATMVYGVTDGTIYASARARGADLDLGEAMRDAFGQIGSAGGHADMAGAQITLGVLDTVDDRDQSLHEIVRSVVNDRFLDAVDSRSHRLLGSVYTRSEYRPETFTEDEVSDLELHRIDDTEDGDVEGLDSDGGESSQERTSVDRDAA